MSTYLGVISAVFVAIADRMRSPRSVFDADLEEQSARASLGGLEAVEKDIDPEMLAATEALVSAATRLADPRFPIDRVLTLSRSTDVYVASAALAALARRTDIPLDWTNGAIRQIRQSDYGVRFFLLQALAAQATYPVIGSVLSQLDEGIPRSWIESLIARRLAAGETVDVDTLRKNVPRRLESDLADFLDETEDTVGPTLRRAFELWRQDPVSEVTSTTDKSTDGEGSDPEVAEDDLGFLRGIGRVSSQPLNKVPPFLTDRRERLVDRIAGVLSGTPPRSVLLVGEHGAGKTTLTRTAIDRLPDKWIAFEAGAAAIHAGAVYVGELETRVDELARRVSASRVIWLFPELENALYAGQHSRSPRGLLDALIPFLERHEVTLVGEVTPESYARLVAARPRIPGIFEVLRVDATTRDETEAIAEHVLRKKWNVTASPGVLADAFDLAQDFAANASPPANVLRLVETAAADSKSRGGGSELSLGDILSTLSRRSGLPLALLDSATPLDVEGVRAFFEARVLGQRDAVDCIVDRIALIKAGLTDPKRPLGVFFFVGPTGTGKTELAKATAEFVFGTSDRLVRVDMSEFQTPEGLDRLLADTTQSPTGASLVSAVRQNPFSVVLLDEFEKAAAPIWDMFLQVFDDGRLTDQQGQTVDFRRCIIILTSNIGSAIPRSGPLGFGQTSESFRAEAVTSAVEASFRPEFLNRLDQIVVFRPLARDQMKALLDKELAAVLERRGLRSKPWAVIFDESAIDFLIETGFSPDLGARPLKRAVETQLLAPLAKAIVQQHVPEGDQFLFVTAVDDRRIAVKFVDPDEDAGSAHREQLPAETSRDLDLRTLALTPAGDRRSTSLLIRELHRISTEIRGKSVRGRKEEALRSMARRGFWEDRGRFAVLHEVERLDRMEAALRTAEKLGDRLERQLKRRNGTARELAELLAVRLYVLDRALTGLAEKAPEDVFVRIRPSQGALTGEAFSFSTQLGEMYRAWAARRGMRVRQLEARDSLEFAISGLGAGKILVDEAGVHVLERVEEVDGGDRTIERVAVTVQVAPWSTFPEDADTPLEILAARALADQPSHQQVVRRYRPKPSPLVRDSARGYRTGRLERVLGGDFDLF